MGGGGVVGGGGGWGGGSILVRVQLHKNLMLNDTVCLIRKKVTHKAKEKI